jgi:predicted signal transduction protein with EAL and GGDEF domain
VCEATDAEAARQVAERMREQLAAPVLLESGAQVAASASIGLATSPPRDAVDLVSLADVAMYAAKSSGAGVVTYDDRLADATARRDVLRSGLAAALGDGGIGVRYLRVVELDDPSRTSGLDAVPAWHHPELGPLPSRELLAAARDAGIEPDLERHLLTRACGDLRRLLDAGAVTPETRVSVTLSPGGLLIHGLPVAVRSALRDHQLTAEALELRVAESSMTPGGSGTVAGLRAVAEMGVGLVVDRFGREPHSLWRLHEMPLTGLRIEAPAVTAPGADRGRLLRSVLAVAGALGLGVVATDVMTAAQAEALLRGGVSRGQGPLFGSAVTVDALLPGG